MSTALRIDGRTASQEAFYAVACDPRRSVVVEACAGAGKTWMLVSRILRALLDGAQPHEVLAITFTRKAAGEMRTRLTEWLSELGAARCSAEGRIEALRARGLDEEAARELEPALAALQPMLLTSGRSVEISTFHAWFSQLLRVAPFELLQELGVQRDAQLIEDLFEHADDVFRRFYKKVAADPTLRADFDELVRRRGRFQTRRWLFAAFARRVDIEQADRAGSLEGSVEPGHDGNGHPNRRMREPDVRSVLAALGQRLGAHRNANPRKAAVKLVDAFARSDDAECLAGVLEALFTEAGEPRKGFDVAGFDDAIALMQELRAVCHQHDAHLEHGRMVRLSRALFAEYAAYKRERGLADMADLEACALALLRDANLAGWVQERLDARVRHVLVDEFQDTSPLQWQALHEWLSAYAGAGGGRQPPSVFIVGDPKQSIYRFRGAEPRVFEAAKVFVARGLGGHVLECDHTRRNTPQIIDKVNEIFVAAERRGEFDGFRPHSTHVPAADEAGMFALPQVPRVQKAKASLPQEIWRDSLTVPRHEPEEVLQEEEAKRVAAAVRQAIDGGASPKDIHVLCRKRESLRLVADALAAWQVPFAAVEDSPLMESPEVRDLVALLDALASTTQRLSLAQALRSPVFGIDDDELVTLAHQASSHGGDWWRALREVDSTRPRLARARELMTRWHGLARQMSPHDLLDAIVSEGDVMARVASAVGPQRRHAALGAIDALLGEALSLDGARYATPYRFVRALKQRRVQASARTNPQAVQLLTVHGAKGLEADTVFVMDADPMPRNPETATLLIDWPVDAAAPRCCAFVYAESQCPLSLRDLLNAENDARRREELNSLYVAMTRARRCLVFSSTQPMRPSLVPSWWSRMEPIAQAWPERSQPPVDVSLQPVVQMPALPTWSTRPPTIAAVEDPSRDDASRLGEAVHRVLEWAAVRPACADIAALAEAAARDFMVEPAAVQRVAQAIWRSPSCARFFRGDAVTTLRWAGNEVSVAEGGDVLRIDRLVEAVGPEGSTWWILDYKLQQRPQDVQEYRLQMARYRAAVEGLQPHAKVRSAFITGTGELVEIG